MRGSSTGSDHWLVISPHCDDAVFSCGRWLAAMPGALVATLFAGRPPAGSELTEWDRAAGFQPGDDVIGVRREEDRRALEMLGAHSYWFDFCDSQYGLTPRVETVTRALARLIDEVETRSLLAPLGLFHSDHRLSHEAVIGVLARRPRLSVWLYEDALYRRIPGLLDARTAECRRAGLRLERVQAPPAGDVELKRRAVRCYASQLRALATPGRPGHGDTTAEEGFWRLGR
ncbi:PIG-L deacetylase family protein [Candidatus Nitrospira bockiana]